MPHGESWFSFLSIYAQAVALATGLGDAQGKTWLAHEPVGLHHVFGLLLVLLILSVVGVITYLRMRDTQAALIPESKFTVATFAEVLVQSVYNMMRSMMGAHAARFFLPLVGSCAFVILFSNALGLVPGFTPPTDKLNTTLALSSVIFISTHVFGVKEHGLGYFKHFFGPYIAWFAIPINLLIFVIEIISHTVRPISLAIRLMVNMVADHLVLSVIIGMLIGGLGWLGVVIPVPTIIMMLGVVVVLVQTVVFCLLSTVYISMAVSHEGH